MRRGAKPVTAMVVAGRPAGRKSRASSPATASALKQRLAEALDREAATSEILRIISQSPTGLQPVFDAIVKNAVRLCEARFGAVFRLDGGLVHVAAHHNFGEVQTWYPMAPNRGHVSGRTILTGAAVQVPDILADEEYLGTTVKSAGFRSMLGVPLLHGGRPIGA